MAKDEIIESGYELYKKMQEYGFDPRKGIGRDDCLYKGIKRGLKCPKNMGLTKYLKTREVSAASFLASFLNVGEPFSEMYKGIYTTMKQFQTKKASEVLKIRFDDKNDTMKDLDFSEFEKYMSIFNKIKQMPMFLDWTKKDYRRLKDYLISLGIQDWAHVKKLRGFQPCLTILHPVCTGHKKIDSMAVKIYFLLKRTDELIGPHRNDDDMSYSCPEGQTLEYDHVFVLETFPALVGLYNGLIESIEKSSSDLNQIEEAIKTDDEIFKKLNDVRVLEERLVRNFETILNLPFWRYRWYVYEIWVTCSVIQVLQEFHPKLNIDDNGVLCLVRGKESIVAKFKLATADEEYVIAAQVYTPAQVVAYRKGIVPDIRIAKADYKKRENTLLLIECKQRKRMGRESLQENIEVYELETPESVQNIFVNYDVFPEIEKKYIKTEIFSEFQPGNITVKLFEKLLKSSLQKFETLPDSCRIDVILIDISGSMRNQYNSNQIVNRLLVLKKINPNLICIPFDTELKYEIEIDNQILENIKKKIGGGTNITYVLESLRVRYPECKRLLILTDVSAPLIEHMGVNDYKIKVCLPEKL